LFQSIFPTNRVNGEFTNAEAGNVIKTLMRREPQIKYTLPPDLTERLTMKFSDVEFGTAINYVCQATSLTYTVEGDTIAFRRVAGEPASRTPKTVTTIQGAAVKSTSLTQVPPIDRQVKELHAKSEPAYKVLRRALDAAGVNYVVSDALKNPISISVKNVPMREVLDAIMPLCNGQYTELTNIVLITQNQ
jgi:hypothetical protein